MKKGQLISFKLFREKKSLEQAFARGRKPLFANPQAYAKDRAEAAQIQKVSAFDKIKKIRERIREINRLT